MNNEYRKLDKSIQRWMFKQGWTGLRDVQNRAVAPILSGVSDVVVSASTAAGKTEAFFLPAISAVIQAREGANTTSSKGNAAAAGIEILYISPLKALINDQYRRLEELSELTGIQITSWHGDSSESGKAKQRKSPSGIILITPESLEALLINRSSWCEKAFKNLQYVVIDEFHAFLGTERGTHLISLLTRLEYIAGRVDKPIPRVALSATLGNIESTPEMLRPSRLMPCAIIKEADKAPNVRVLLKAFVNPSDKNGDGSDKLITEAHLSSDIYKFCRGGNNLVFANSRGLVEQLSANLRDMCIDNVVPNEFFPHHGSLSKEHREGLEHRLQKGAVPTTAVCTMTLELGIDIGKVDSVVQVTTPHSVASLRQRLGRSGRRGGPSTLRMLVIENELDIDSNIMSSLRLELVQAMAMIRLLLIDRWFEPADSELMHFSTLLHQVLACIGQYGGIQIGQLYELLCKKGAFQNVTVANFKVLLKAMSELDLIVQLGDNQLALGLVGEGVVGHYTFYAAFKTPEEYRIAYNNVTIGTIPVDTLVGKDSWIVFGGKRWLVKNVDTNSKVIDVKLMRGGGKPPIFTGGDLEMHERIAQEMFSIYTNGDYRIPIGDRKVDFVDDAARALFKEGLNTFRSYQLSEDFVVGKDASSYIFMWAGSKVVNTLAQILKLRHYDVDVHKQVICLRKTSTEEVYQTLRGIYENELPTGFELASCIEIKGGEKFDEHLPEELLNIGTAAKMFDTDGLNRWLESKFG